MASPENYTSVIPEGEHSKQLLCHNNVLNCCNHLQEMTYPLLKLYTLMLQQGMLLTGRILELNLV